MRMKLKTSFPADHADEKEKVCVHFECARLVAESIVALLSLCAYVSTMQPKTPELSAPWHNWKHKILTSLITYVPVASCTVDQYAKPDN